MGHRWVVVVIAASVAIAPRDARADRVRVTVHDRGGRPIQAALVWAAALSPVLELPPSARHDASTDAEGLTDVECQSDDVLVVIARGFEMAIVPVRDAGGAPLVLNDGRDVVAQMQWAEPRDEIVIEWSATAAVRARVRVGRDARARLPALPLAAVPVSLVDGGRRVERVVPPRVTEVTFVLPRGASVNGRVLSPDGQPVTSAVIRMVAGAMRVAMSDAGGRFVLDGLPAGSREVEVAAEGFRTEVLVVDLGERSAIALPDVLLRPSPDVDVRFVDARTGVPLVEPHVVAESLDAAGFSVRDVLTSPPDFTGDREGYVRLAGLRVGLHRFVLASPGYARIRLPDFEITDTTERIDLGTILIDEGAEARLSVVDAGGESVTDLPVRLDHGPGVSPLSPQRTVTDADGVATLRFLGPGRYRLRVGGDERPGGAVAVAQRWFDVKPGEGRVDLELTVAGTRLELRVMTDSAPVAGASVRVAAGEDPIDEFTRGLVVQTPDRMINAPFRRASNGITDETGTAVLEQVPVGPVQISLVGDGWTWTTPSVVEPGGGPQTVVIPNRSARTVVVDGTRSEGLRARVEWVASGGVRVAAFADPEGAVTLPGLPESSGMLRAVAPGFATQELTLPSPSAIPAVIVLSPVPDTRLTVQVRDAGGAPLADATVGATDLADGSIRQFAQTGAAGTAELVLRYPRAQRVLVSRGGYAAAVQGAVPVRPGAGNSIDVRLHPGYRVTMAVGEIGDPSTAMQVRVRDATGALLPDAVFDDASSLTLGPGSEGTVGLLAPGRYLFEFVGPSTRFERRVSITDADVTISVP